MAMATKAGDQLRHELNDLFRRVNPAGDIYIPLDKRHDMGLLMRRAKRYAKMQEDACNYGWACGDEWDAKEEKLEQQITELAVTLPGVTGVKFTGDPRGYTVRLLLACGRGNTWGGDEDGWGIA